MIYKASPEKGKEKGLGAAQRKYVDIIFVPGYFPGTYAQPTETENTKGSAVAKKKSQHSSGASPVVFRTGRRCFSRAAALPEGCAPHPEDPLVLIVDREDPALIARALWTENVKAVIVRPETEGQDVLELRARMSAHTLAEALQIGRYALGNPLIDPSEPLRETADLSLHVRRRTRASLSDLFQSIAGRPPELGMVRFRPRPEDSQLPDGYGFHDDSHVTLVAFKCVYGAGTVWVQGYQPPEEVMQRRVSVLTKFYGYGAHGKPDEGIRILEAKEGDTFFFFGRNACSASPAFPAFIHSVPPLSDPRAASRMLVATYTKRGVDFPDYLIS